MKVLVLTFSLMSYVTNSDIMLPVLLQVSNRTSDRVRAPVSALMQHSLSSQDSGDAAEHVIHFKSSSSSDPGRQGFSASEEEEATAASAVESKLTSIITRVQRMYNSILDLRFSDIENIRFHVIIDEIVPDFSAIKNVCPFECSGCLESYAEIFCRICCEEHIKEPMSISSFLYNHFDHVLDWMTSSMGYKGLKAIYNNMIGRGMRRDDQHVFNPQEMNTFIRNFYWQHQHNSLDPKMPEEFEANLNQSTFSAPDICGYYEQEGSRADQGRIVGGKKVESLSMFPWQMSLSSGYYGFFYQHRLKSCF